MIHKKAQSQIITTILIILLVLAAIVIVWQVVSNTIREGAGEIERQTDCLGISMTVTPGKSPTNVNQVTIKREPGGKVLTGTSVVYIKNGNNVAYPGVQTFTVPLTSETIVHNGVTITLATGDVIEVALKLSDGTICPITGKGTVL